MTCVIALEILFWEKNDSNLGIRILGHTDILTPVNNFYSINYANLPKN